MGGGVSGKHALAQGNFRLASPCASPRHKVFHSKNGQLQCFSSRLSFSSLKARTGQPVRPGWGFSKRCVSWNAHALPSVLCAQHVSFLPPGSWHTPCLASKPLALPPGALPTPTVAQSRDCFWEEILLGRSELESEMHPLLLYSLFQFIFSGNKSEITTGGFPLV